MKKWHWVLPAAVLALGLLRGATAWAAEAAPTSEAGKATAASKDAGASPFREEPQAPPQPEAEDEAAAAATPPAGLPELQPADQCGTCGACPTNGACYSGQCAGACPQYVLSPGCGDSCVRQYLRGITVGVWADSGVTVNGRMPADRFNGPVAFNDRDGEYQLNQLYTYIEKELDTSRTGWDAGGRIDFLYGTDWRFTNAVGLEDDWNSRRFYGSALPQAYADFGVGDWSVRIGHFYSIIGYEGVPAPDNFFYSHSYSFQYGEPHTATGLLASYALGESLTVTGGIDRGWDRWSDNNHDVNFLGGICWKSWSGATTAAFAINSGPYDNAGDLNRMVYSVVLTQKFSNHFQYVIQHDLGFADGGGLIHRDQTTEDAEWYSINQYFLYEINECWALGMRVEWFVDDDGTRVGGIGAPHGWTLGPDVGPDHDNRIGWAGEFANLTFGLNWQPSCNFLVRPECRWDWYGGPADGLGRRPFDFGSRDNQFTFGTDVIMRF